MDKRFVDCRSTSNAGPECGYSGWRPLQVLPISGFLHPTVSKRCAATDRGQYSIRINDQWRVCFIWTDRGAMEIEVADYH